MTKTYTPQSLSWLSLVLNERFGLDFNISLKESSLLLSIKKNDAKKIVFPVLTDSFFINSSDTPCAEWDPQEEGFVSPLNTTLPAPCVEVLPSPLIETKENLATINYDILGLTYWMLNRIEEIGRTDLDNHNRFPAVNSHAFKHNYLERPIVDEWLHILGQVIQKIWPEAELKKQKFSMKVSHDVDQPSQYGFKPWKTIIRMMAGHLLKRHDLKAFFQAPYIKITTHKKLHKKDPYNTFDRIMDISEKHNLISAFYFICGHTSEYDGDYEIEDPIMQELLQRIHSRGHEIGLHPSYGTFQTPELIKNEAERLRAACKMAGTEQKSYGGRMHYLRWEHPTTLQAWEDAGMHYDTTLSYADRPGFRCGSCFEYPAFNPVTQELLNIRIRPLIAMECTIIAERYMNLGYSEAALSKFIELKNSCRQVNGCFTLLWHNSHFTNKEDFELYERVIKY